MGSHYSVFVNMFDGVKWQLEKTANLTNFAKDLSSCYKYFHNHQPVFPLILQSLSGGPPGTSHNGNPPGTPPWGGPLIDKSFMITRLELEGISTNSS